MTHNESMFRYWLLAEIMVETPFDPDKLPKAMREFKPQISNFINTMKRAVKKMEVGTEMRKLQPDQFDRLKLVYNRIAVFMTEFTVQDIERLEVIFSKMLSGDNVEVITSSELRSRDESNRTAISMMVKQSVAWRSLDEFQRRDIESAINKANLKYQINDESNS